MKNKMAVALGRRGGKAKNAKLTAEQRKEATAKARATLAEKRAEKARQVGAMNHLVDCPKEGCRISTGHQHI
jgi:hypothetical protein